MSEPCRLRIVIDVDSTVESIELVEVLTAAFDVEVMVVLLDVESVVISDDV